MKLFFHRVGQGEPVVLLHGLFGLSDNLMPLARALAPHCSVYVPDLRNHGRSDHHEAMDYSVMAADIALMLDEQGIRHAHIVGHSMGGKVAMQLALSYPHKVKSLVVVDIAPIAYPPFHESVFRGLYAVRQANPETRREAEAILDHHVGDVGVRRFLIKNLVKSEGGRFDWRFNLDGIANAYHKLRDGLVWTQPYQGPVLLVKGELSSYISREHEGAMRAAFPSFQFKMIQGAGHWLHVDKPVAFQRLVERFLQVAPLPGEEDILQSA